MFNEVHHALETQALQAMFISTVTGVPLTKLFIHYGKTITYN